ncbi:hypothetical protein [Candidatus Binatus sp.]|jgi:hypothetical protein|uniref:hypothetical protein n=1 Tax=Candidatus Binatus sp. TaxID=2811406 RepID=UPI003BD642FF
MSSWTFYFTALPLGLAVVILAFAAARALTHDQGAIFAATVAVAMVVGYTIGRLDGPVR